MRLVQFCIKASPDEPPVSRQVHRINTSAIEHAGLITLKIGVGVRLLRLRLLGTALRRLRLRVTAPPILCLQPAVIRQEESTDR